MGLKNINIFEQHVEKIVLLVAAAGAVFMGYLALQKVTIPDTDVGPSDVEPRIKAEIAQMDRKRDDLERQGPPKVAYIDYVQDYKNKSSGQPLEALPELVHAEALQLAVAEPKIDPLTGLPAALAAGTQYVTQIRNVVVIDGWVPVGRMVLDMIKETDNKKKFTADVQRGLVYRVRVLRQELQSNGWTKDWEEVKPAKGSAAPTVVYDTTMPPGALPGKIAEIDGQFQQIQLPTFYVDALGVAVPAPILARPIPKPISDENAKLHNDLEAARAGAVAGIRFVTTAPAILPGAAGVTGTQPAGEMLPTVDQIKLREVQPFTFWDESVQPDHTYQYKVQVQLVNPGFGWTWGLANQALKNEPCIPVKDEGFVAVPGAVVVHSDLAFFIRGSNGPAGGINGRIYKQENGRWYYSEFSVPNGMNVGGQLNLGPNNYKDVDTKFALVDVQTLGNTAHVILKDPSGNLVTREAPDDFRKPENDDLYNKAKAAAAAAATMAAATEPAAAPVTPTTPTRGGTTPVTPTRGVTPVPVNPPPTRGPIPVRP